MNVFTRPIHTGKSPKECSNECERLGVAGCCEFQRKIKKGYTGRCSFYVGVSALAAGRDLVQVKKPWMQVDNAVVCRMDAAAAGAS